MVSTNPPRSRAVRFSQFSELTTLPNESIQSKAYSPADMRRFKQDLINHAKYLKLVLTSTQAEMVTQEDLYECIGIELLLNRGLAMHAAKSKRSHIHAIITGQHILNEEELADVSTISSRSARDRAAKFASSYSGISKGVNERQD